MKIEVTYDQALRLANELLKMLRPACRRIEIAGSLRRNCRQIGDIEFVAIPVIEVMQYKDLLGEVYRTDTTSLIDVALANFNKIKNGPKYKQFLYKGMPVDLFLQTPETWSVNFMIRTGSKDFAKWMVTHQGNGGAMPGDMRSDEARLWRWQNGQWNVLDTPQEEDVFEAVGLDFVPPDQRGQGRWR